MIRLRDWIQINMGKIVDSCNMRKPGSEHSTLEIDTDEDWQCFTRGFEMFTGVESDLEYIMLERGVDWVLFCDHGTPKQKKGDERPTMRFFFHTDNPVMELQCKLALE
jgi:hypothetical protein